MWRIPYLLHRLEKKAIEIRGKEVPFAYQIDRNEEEYYWVLGSGSENLRSLYLEGRQAYEKSYYTILWNRTIRAVEAIKNGLVHWFTVIKYILFFSDNHCTFIINSTKYFYKENHSSPFTKPNTLLMGDWKKHKRANSYSTSKRIWWHGIEAARVC